DLADPENPAFVGQYAPYYVHDVLVRGDTMYTAGIYGEGIDIVDISDRAAPSMVARFNYPGSGVHNFCSDPSGTYLYAGDEIGSGQWYRIFDVRDPHDVELVGEIIIDAGSTVHNCHTKDGLLYIAHYGRRVWVSDITYPANPEQVAYYDDPRTGPRWTVNPRLPSGKIVASDMGNGLQVLRIDDLPGPSLTAQLDPVSPPVVVPPAGGTFAYTARVTNGDDAPHAFDAWITATLPNGSPYGPVAGPLSVTLPAGGSAQRTLRLRVPAAAPAGTYTLTLNVGEYPSGVEASDAFTFEKGAAGAAVAARAEGPVELVAEGAFFDAEGSEAAA